MKVVILAGGAGQRMSEITNRIPKPMAQIGGYPMLWHIMKLYSFYGFNEFIICLGYKGYVIKEYFLNYFLYESDLTIDCSNNKIKIENNLSEPWTVTLIDTGLSTKTGGRLKRIKDYITDDCFMMTYGDGVADINIKNLLDFYYKNGHTSTLSLVRPHSSYGVVALANNKNVSNFSEKPREKNDWINIGYMVLNCEIFDYIKDDQTIFEREPLQNLSKQNKLLAYKHNGFWKSMDTLNDLEHLEQLWDEGNAHWKVW